MDMVEAFRRLAEDSSGAPAGRFFDGSCECAACGGEPAGVYDGGGDAIFADGVNYFEGRMSSMQRSAHEIVKSANWKFLVSNNVARLLVGDIYDHKMNDEGWVNGRELERAGCWMLVIDAPLELDIVNGSE